MKALSFAVILILFTSLVAPTVQNTRAIPYMSPEDLYKQSNMVFYGQVISKQTGPGPDYNYYQVKVETYFKNQQTSDSITVAGHMSDNKTGLMPYPQFEIGDKAIFYIEKEEGINVISPYSTKAGEGCDIQAFLSSAPIPSETRIMRGPPAETMRILDSQGMALLVTRINLPLVLNFDDIWNNLPQPRNVTVVLTIHRGNDANVTFYQKQEVPLLACDGPKSMSWNFTPVIAGHYNATLTYDNKIIETDFDVRENTSGNSIDKSSYPPSPLIQLKSGIAVKDVECYNGYALVIKKEGHLPACVNPDTISKLVLRGWTENPLNELLLRYGNQTQANLIFYEVMNEPKVREWSMTGWKYNSYSYASNSDTQKFSATISLYLPPNTGNHLECENGSYALVVMNLKPVEIEHNYTEVGCEIVQLTSTGMSFPLANATKSNMTGKNSNPSSPLKLSLLIDNQYANPAEPLGVDISLNNTSSSQLIVNEDDNWTRNDLNAGSCSTLPFGIAILKGYYTEQNMSNANSLVIFPNLPCPLPPKIKSYTFQPFSTKATGECDNLFSCAGLVDMKTHLELSGFIDSTGLHRPFDIGTYTIIAGDEWRDVTMQHFTEAYATALNVSNSVIPESQNSTSALRIISAGGPITLTPTCPICTPEYFNETTTYTGNVGKIIPGYPILVKISDPYTMSPRTDKIPASKILPNGTFHYTITVTGKFGLNQYTLLFVYGNQSVNQTLPVFPP